MALGYTSRKLAYQLPDFINIYLGDALWALMVYLMMGFVFKKSSIVKVALLATIFCYGIEISQLYHAPWIDAIRHTTFGGLVLGFGFLWSDILAYTLGIIFGVLNEWLFDYFLHKSMNFDLNRSK
ncbi:MAG: hypothetical protein JWQ25_2359 [Daejeonella sp.]|nr:hypothetical protein [Daejeonella sp.]